MISSSARGGALSEEVRAAVSDEDIEVDSSDQGNTYKVSLRGISKLRIREDDGMCGEINDCLV